MEININYLAVIVAAATSIFIGALWFGVICRKQWMKLMNFTEESMEHANMTANKAYIIQAIASFVMAYVLAHAVIFGSAYTGIDGVLGGILAGFFYWLGFVAPVTLGMVLWEGKPWKLWLINVSQWLVSLLIMGVILSVWN